MRKALLNDVEFIHHLRYSPDVRKISCSKNIVSLKEFRKYFINHYKEYKIIGNNIGFIRKDKDNFISIVLLKKYRNRGIGRKLVSNLRGRAIILLNNFRSFNCFIKANWKLKGWYLEK